MRNVKPTNKVAESAFGLYDYLLRRLPNVSSVTLSALTAAKGTNPFEWIRNNCTREQILHLFNWARQARSRSRFPSLSTC
jgi:hypothetical protein